MNQVRAEKGKGTKKGIPHWQQNLIKFLDDEVISKSDAAKLLSQCQKALRFPKYRRSTAVIVKMSRKVEQDYGHRDFWGDNDTLVAIIRNGKVCTVMLTRSGQCHNGHFRTDCIFK